MRWLGLDLHLPLGLLCAPPSKRLRAIEVLSRVIEGPAPAFDAYRRLVGLLEHLLPFVGLDRTYMYHIYDPFARGARDPAAPIAPSDVVRERCVAWRDTLVRVAGVACTVVLRYNAPTPGAAAPLYMYSDAAKEGATIDSGLGGYMHGLWWSLPLGESDLEMPIVLLEFIAFSLNFIVFEPWLRGSAVIARSDSLGTVQVINRLSAKSATLQFVHSALIALPTFLAAVAMSLVVAHV